MKRLIADFFWLLGAFVCVVVFAVLLFGGTWVLGVINATFS